MWFAVLWCGSIHHLVVLDLLVRTLRPGYQDLVAYPWRNRIIVVGVGVGVARCCTLVLYYLVAGLY